MKSNRAPFRWRLSAVGLLLAALVVPTASAATIIDRIWLRGKAEPQSGTVTEASIDGVKMGQAQFSLAGVVKIAYGDAPRGFRDGLSYREQGRYDEAVRALQSALRGKLGREWWVKPDSRYYIALCYLEEGADLAKAEKAFEELVEKHPTTRFLPDAILGLGRVKFTQGKYKDAIVQFDKLISLAARKAWESWQYQGYLWKARALRQDTRYKEALALIKKIVDNARDAKFEDVYTEALTEQAILLMDQGTYDAAIDLLGKLVKRIAPAVAKEIGDGSETRMQRTEARCFNTLGACYLKMGNKATGAKKEGYHRDALLAFLWTVVLYQRLPAEHAEALFNAAECFNKLKQQKRATELANELSQRYPDSPYTRRVQPKKK